MRGFIRRMLQKVRFYRPKMYPKAEKRTKMQFFGDFFSECIADLKICITFALANEA